MNFPGLKKAGGFAQGVIMGNTQLHLKIQSLPVFPFSSPPLGLMAYSGAFSHDQCRFENDPFDIPSDAGQGSDQTCCRLGSRLKERLMDGGQRRDKILRSRNIVVSDDCDVIRDMGS